MKNVLFTIGTILTLITPVFAQQDLQLDTLIFQTKTDSFIHSYYSKIPWNQAKSDTVRFMGVVTNNSSLPNTNVVFTSQVSTPLNTDTLYSTPINLAPFQTDTIEINAPFTFADSTGKYTWFFSTTSDSTDTILTNNSKDTLTISVTDTSFARDRNASGNYLYGASGYDLAVRFDILDTVKATSVTLYLGTNTSVGGFLSIYIYDESFQILSKREFVVPSDTNSKDTYLVPEVVLNPGKYFVSFKTYDTLVSFQKSDFMADSGIAYLDTTDTGNWHPLPFVPPIRLNITDDHWWCDIKFKTRVTHNCDTFFVIPHNGIPPYTFLWDDGSTLNYVLSPWYFDPRIVTVTDSIGCVATFAAGCVGSVNEFTENPVSIFPNPTNELINIEIDTSVNPREHAFEMYDILGKRVLSITLTTSLTSVDISHLKAGVYICKFGESKVRVMIE